MACCLSSSNTSKPCCTLARHTTPHRIPSQLHLVAAVLDPQLGGDALDVAHGVHGVLRVHDVGVLGPEGGSRLCPPGPLRPARRGESKLGEETSTAALHTPFHIMHMCLFENAKCQLPFVICRVLAEHTRDIPHQRHVV